MLKLKIAVESGWNSIAFVWQSFTIGLMTVFESMASSIRGVWRTAVFEIAKWITWVGEKVGLVGEGATAEVARMRAAAQKSDDKSVAKRDAQRYANAQAKLDAAKAREDALAAQLANLEGQAVDAYAEAGAPTINEAAANAKAQLEAAIKAANEGADKQGATPPQLGELGEATTAGTARTAKLASTGTFSAAGALALGLGSNRPAEKTADNTGRALTYLRQIAKNKPADPQFGV